MILRMVSFCLEKIDLYEKVEKDGLSNVKENQNFIKISDYKFIDLYLYTFYPTFFFVAPFITYQSFYIIFVSISMHLQNLIMP